MPLRKDSRTFPVGDLSGAGVGRGAVAAQRLDVNFDVDMVLAEFKDAVLEVLWSGRWASRG